MHITNPQSAILTNHEVLLHLRAEDAEYTGKDGSYRERPKPPGLAHTLRDGIAYLQTPDYAVASIPSTHPDRPMTLYKGPHSLFRALAPRFRLNKAEYLQLFNLRPKTEVELQLVIEEASTRFTDNQLYDMLDIIHQVLDEDESLVPEGAEHQEMDKIPNKLLGAKRRKRRATKRKA